MTIDGAALRTVMRLYPTGVVVITVRGDEGPRGMTAGSFGSLSLVPPLISFNVMNSSRLHGALHEGGSFAVNILGDHQAALSDWFAKPGLTSREQFEGISHRMDEDGTPLLDGCLGWLACRTQSLLPGGDHEIVNGAVLRTSPGQPGRPLVFHGGGYHRLGERIELQPLPQPPPSRER